MTRSLTIAIADDERDPPVGQRRLMDETEHRKRCEDSSQRPHRSLHHPNCRIHIICGCNDKAAPARRP